MSSSSKEQEEFLIPVVDEYNSNRPQPPGSDPKRSYESRRILGLQRVISISCWSVVVIAIGCVAIIAVVLGISATLGPERKVFLGTIMAVVVIVLLILLFICRKDFEALVIYIPILSGVSGLCLGLSIWYL